MLPVTYHVVVKLVGMTYDPKPRIAHLLEKDAKLTDFDKKVIAKAVEYAWQYADKHNFTLSERKKLNHFMGCW